MDRWGPQDGTNLLALGRTTTVWADVLDWEVFRRDPDPAPAPATAPTPPTVGFDTRDTSPSDTRGDSASTRSSGSSTTRSSTRSSYVPPTPEGGQGGETPIGTPVSEEALPEVEVERRDSTPVN